MSSCPSGSAPISQSPGMRMRLLHSPTSSHISRPTQICTSRSCDHTNDRSNSNSPGRCRSPGFPPSLSGLFEKTVTLNEEEIKTAFDYLAGPKGVILRSDLENKIGRLKKSAWPRFADLMTDNEEITFEALCEFLRTNDLGSFNTVASGFKLYKRDVALPHSLPRSQCTRDQQERELYILTDSELAEAMSRLVGHELGLDDLRALKRVLDVDGDGVVSVDDYNKMYEVYRRHPDAHFSPEDIPSPEDVLLAAGEAVSPMPDADDPLADQLMALASGAPAATAATSPPPTSGPSDGADADAEGGNDQAITRMSVSFAGPSTDGDPLVSSRSRGESPRPPYSGRTTARGSTDGSSGYDASDPLATARSRRPQQFGTGVGPMEGAVRQKRSEAGPPSPNENPPVAAGHGGKPPLRRR